MNLLLTNGGEGLQRKKVILRIIGIAILFSGVSQISSAYASKISKTLNTEDMLVIYKESLEK